MEIIVNISLYAFVFWLGVLSQRDKIRCLEHIVDVMEFKINAMETIIDEKEE